MISTKLNFYFLLFFYSFKNGFLDNIFSFLAPTPKKITKIK